MINCLNLEIYGSKKFEFITQKIIIKFFLKKICETIIIIMIEKYLNFKNLLSFTTFKNFYFKSKSKI
jgi:hypothetical protein